MATMATEGMHGRSSPMRTDKSTPQQRAVVRLLAKIAKRHGVISTFKIEWSIGQTVIWVRADEVVCIVRQNGSVIWL